MRSLLLTITLTLITAACSHKRCCQDHCAKKMKHDKEHHHVKTGGDHAHEEGHHKEHDHKAHHPNHDEDMKNHNHEGEE